MRDHASGEDYFYHQDDLFSVYAMTDEAGTIVERYEYGDYGQVSIMAEEGTSRAASLYGNRHTFTGRLLDEELTLAGGEQTLQYRNRYLMAGSARFLQRDPLGYHDSDNLYQYTKSSPLVYMDPTGEILCSTLFANIAHSKYADSNDKFKHCWVTCMATRYCGPQDSVPAGILKELNDLLIDRQPWWDSLADCDANLSGINWWEALLPGGILGGKIKEWIWGTCESRCRHLNTNPRWKPVPNTSWPS